MDTPRTMKEYRPYFHAVYGPSLNGSNAIKRVFENFDEAHSCVIRIRGGRDRTFSKKADAWSWLNSQSTTLKTVPNNTTQDQNQLNESLGNADNGNLELDRQAVSLGRAYPAAKSVCKSFTAWEYILRQASDTIKELQANPDDLEGKLTYLTYTLEYMRNDMESTHKDMATWPEESSLKIV